jgi:hypothetical protein
MKKVMLMTLALVMTMCLASYGSAGSNVSTSSVPETPAVVTEVANTTTETSETSDMTNPAYWSKEVDIHCTPELIEKFGYDTLAPLVQRIKDQIVPRAIGALTEAYPAFNDEGAVGTEISLFIYGADEDTNKSEIYQGLVQPQNAAYVLGGTAENGYSYVLGVNAAPLLNKEGTMIEDEIKTLENTLTHELLHGIMYDYNRTGMDSHDYDPYVIKNHFPLWFMEGYTTASENGFQYWQPMIKDARENGTFTKESVANFFGVDSHSFYRTEDGTEDQMVYSYIGGYLALVYLAPIVSGIKTTGTDVTTADVRDGMNTILSLLHNGTSLDAIIAEKTPYDGIDDFEAKFLKTDDPSSQYCVDFLNRLDAVSGENGEKATGSVLLQDFDTTQVSVLEGRTETSATQTVMRIKASNEPDLSTVPDSVAHQSAGVRHVWQDVDAFVGQ